MIHFAGSYFDGHTSKAHPVTIHEQHGTLSITTRHKEVHLHYATSLCSVTDPLHNGSRSLLLPDGGRCESPDRVSMDALATLCGSKGGVLVNWLEQYWSLAVGCLVALVACVWLFSVYGIPFLAEKIAYSLPVEANEALSEEVVKIMDRSIFQPTTLSAKQRQNVQYIFDNLVKENSSHFHYRLAFRNSPRVGPNAFALPSGLVLVTDELIDLAQEEELESIFVHEIAHVEKRHSLRSVLQNSGVFFLISALVGDVVSTTSIAASLPTLLLETSYSRKYEQEADDAVARFCSARGRTTIAYQNILRKLTHDRPQIKVMGFFSTHPLTNERIERLQFLDQQSNHTTD